MKRNLLAAQSGGPTCAINATLAGIISQAIIQDDIGRIYGGRNGIKGILQKKIVDLGDSVKNTADLHRLFQTPGSALGSCRFKLPEPENDPSSFQALVEILREYEISYFLYIGGNDSMDTVEKIYRYCKINSIEDIKIIGVPKTIDNDLEETDHCPGFGSAARYIAATFRELERDLAVYDSFGVTIVEVMGRNTGWLTAASALAGVMGGRGPDFIYLCEKPFCVSSFLKDIQSRQSQNRGLLIAVSEGLRDEKGNYICNLNVEWEKDGSALKKSPVDPGDGFGHQNLAGTASVLADIVRSRLDCKARYIQLNLMQRCAGHLASSTDLSEAWLMGAKAVQCALAGQSGKMVTLQRLPAGRGYEISLGSVDVRMVANREKAVPLEWINDLGNNITADMTEYLLPLITGDNPAEAPNYFPQYMIIP